MARAKSESIAGAKRTRPIRLRLFARTSHCQRSATMAALTHVRPDERQPFVTGISGVNNTKREEFEDDDTCPSSVFFFVVFSLHLTSDDSGRCNDFPDVRQRSRANGLAVPVVKSERKHIKTEWGRAGNFSPGPSVCFSFRGRGSWERNARVKQASRAPECAPPSPARSNARRELLVTLRSRRSPVLFPESHLSPAFVSRLFVSGFIDSPPHKKKVGGCVTRQKKRKKSGRIVHPGDSFTVVADSPARRPMSASYNWPLYTSSFSLSLALISLLVRRSTPASVSIARGRVSH